MIFLDVLPPDLQANYALVYEARAVHDTATLQLSDYHISAGSTWVVAVVKPAAGSGSATVPGAYIEAETGRFVNPGQADTLVVKKGTWQAIAAAAPSAPANGNYSWTEPLERRARVVTPEDYYSPFAYGGTIVFQYEPMAEGAQRFDECRLIFPEWKQSAADTLKASPQLAEVFAKAATQPASLAEAGQMIAGDNGVSATLAFRILLKSSDSFAAKAPAVFKAADVRELSTFVYLSLVASTAKDRSQWIVELGNLVKGTQDPDRLLAIAYAAFAVSLFVPQDPAAVTAARQVLSDLHKRVGELGIPVRENSPWFLIFRKSGFT